MLLKIVTIIIVIYLFCGVVFTIPFLSKGIKIINNGRYRRNRVFTLIIIPGVIIFWPLLLVKWLVMPDEALEQEDA